MSSEKLSPRGKLFTFPDADTELFDEVAQALLDEKSFRRVPVNNLRNAKDIAANKFLEELIDHLSPKEDGPSSVKNGARRKVLMKGAAGLEEHQMLGFDVVRGAAHAGTRFSRPSDLASKPVNAGFFDDKTFMQIPLVGTVVVTAENEPEPECTLSPGNLYLAKAAFKHTIEVTEDSINLELVLREAYGFDSHFVWNAYAKIQAGQTA